MPKLIGITFPDNDFGNTVRAFLKIFIDSQTAANMGWLTRDLVADTFNTIAIGVYLIAQSGFERDDPNHLAKLALTYLKITKENVYLGQDVLVHLEATGCDCNHCFHYVDLDQKLIFSC